MYRPKPIDTSAVVLPPELQELTELLAENAHEQWAKTRMDDNWRYGPERDDGARINPCLVPYEQLPESEKVYDRKTAMETVKVLLKLGYQIIPPDKGGC